MPPLDLAAAFPYRGAARSARSRKAAATLIRRLALLIAANAPVAAMPAVAATGDIAAYMHARVAEGDGAVAVAARDYARALAEDAGNTDLAVRSYRAAIRAGDMPLADRAAAMLAAQKAAPSDTILIALADAAHDGDRTAAAAALARFEDDRLRILAPPLRAWLALDSGGDPFAALARVPDEPVARRFAAETRALLLIATGRTGEGIAAVRALGGADDLAALDERVAAARLLIGQGKAADARVLLDDDDGQVALRVSPTRGAMPSFAFGASHLFTRVAADLATGESGPLTYTLLRAALRADPGNDRARLLLAGVLARDDALDAGLALLDEVPADSAYASVAATGRVQMLAAGGRDGAAQAALDRLSFAADAASGDLQRLADLNMQLDRPAAAAPLYARLVERAGARADWADWLQYGAALDGAGDWRKARSALEKAVEKGPDEPLALNYLGYALTLHKERMAAAQAMLEKAARLKPDDAAIADSLGWALYLRGQPARALPLVERAGTADPLNAEIGEHLGDLYWTTGRRFEARYAWTAARATASDAVATRLDDKILEGLR
ncbi:tetratricopeptide (TPR) repeat protein [Sphingomonas sp. BE138]|uniref:tetratricopeptide repeat protein n=1 Tax=Sphingomonas sp. BE138 TaxID=2817845 RepID=UPI00285BDC2F|nr:tetratricopeptide repeat protein [Sphingomonas sp. BE138]MDR6786751.1 tetratricopeptide (TPR) repeat protein [Sphingomonas sp. BE138]